MQTGRSTSPAGPDEFGPAATLPRIVLASASPRRAALLAEIGLSFDTVPSRIAEVRLRDEKAEEFACRIAREKALDVASRCPQRFVLAGDTIVVLDDLIFGKPVDREDAHRMLVALSGRTHRVLTAVALVCPDGVVDEALVESRVEFRRLTEREIGAYLDTGESFDKAGGYAVQGKAGEFVVRVHGSYTNVVGLPVEEVRSLLQRRLTVSRASAEAAR